MAGKHTAFRDRSGDPPGQKALGPIAARVSAGVLSPGSGLTADFLNVIFGSSISAMTNSVFHRMWPSKRIGVYYVLFS